MQIDTRSGMDGLCRIAAATLMLASGVMIRAFGITAENGFRTETTRWTLLPTSWSFLLLVPAMIWLPADRRFLERFQQELADQAERLKPGTRPYFPEIKEVTQ